MNTSKQPFISRALERALQAAITLGLLKGCWLVMRYESLVGPFPAFHKSASQLAVCVGWTALLAGWLGFVARYSRRADIRLKSLVYCLLLIESVPYLVPFGLTWPYSFPRCAAIPVGEAGSCHGARVFTHAEYLNITPVNSEKLYDRQYEAQPAEAAYRVMYVGNSQVRSLAIPIPLKASKIAESLLSRTKRGEEIQILEYAIDGASTTRLLVESEPFRKKYGIRHLLLKYMTSSDNDLGTLPESLQPERLSSEKKAERRGGGDAVIKSAFLQHLLHTPASNLLSLLAWYGTSFYLGLSASDAANGGKEAPPRWPQFEDPGAIETPACAGIVNERLRRRLLDHFVNVRVYFAAVRELNSSIGLPVTFLQIPLYEELLPVAALREKYLVCKNALTRAAYERAIEKTPGYQLVDAGGKVAAAGLDVNDLYFKYDHHLNERGNRLVGEAIAEGLASWSF